MTTKEKAEYLVNQFRIVLMEEETECGNEILCTSIAVKNSLISIKEIISALIITVGHLELTELERFECKQDLNFWNGVLEHLKKY
jgi:hypothetical protein